MSHIANPQLKVCRRTVLLGGALALFLVSNAAHAQRPTPIGQGSASRGVAVGLEGYCPVCIVEMKKWMKGSAEFRTTYDGKVYHFPGQKQLDMFLADPAKYVPALGGDCTVCLAKMGKHVPGSIFHSALISKRLFLFPGKEQQQEFLANAPQYVDTDLAFEGKCVVCRVEMKKDVPGDPSIAAYFQGMRYLFPAAKQRDMFLANPSKYAAKPASNTQTSLESADEQFITVRGKSGCAGCDHGVAPIGAPDELGLAVNGADGRVYVVENAHKLFPKVYEGRFAGLPLEVLGKVVKTDGKVTWIEPKQLKVLN